MMKLHVGSRLATWWVGGQVFDAFGMPGTTDERTALGWRRRYAPNTEITMKWASR